MPIINIINQNSFNCVCFTVTDASVLENELDELEVYGNTEATSGDDKITQYNFQVCYTTVMYFKTPYMKW